jgi:hypothetical protein
MSYSEELNMRHRAAKKSLLHRTVKSVALKFRGCKLFRSVGKLNDYMQNKPKEQKMNFQVNW